MRIGDVESMQKKRAELRPAAKDEEAVDAIRSICSVVDPDRHAGHGAKGLGGHVVRAAVGDGGPIGDPSAKINDV